MSLGVALLLAGSMLAHGGPPSSSDLVFDVGLARGGERTLATSHGYVTSEGRWLCEEIAGSETTTGLVRREGAWLLATTGGLLESAEGCDWAARPGSEGLLLLDLQADRLDPTIVWALSMEGLWAAHEGGAFALERATDFSLRGFAQRSDGEFWLLGFEAGLPIVRLGDTSVELPVVSGRPSIVGLDRQDRVYVRVPVSDQDHLYRIDSAGSLEDLFGLTEPIIAVTEFGDSTYVVQRHVGTRWSSDQGQTWTSARGEWLNCLRTDGVDLFACPDALDAPALVRSSKGGEDPGAWVWEPVIEFPQVAALACAEQTQFASACAPLWPQVALELGVEDSSDASDATSGSELVSGPRGCALATPALELGPLGLFVLVPIVVRRRSSPKR